MTTIDKLHKHVDILNKQLEETLVLVLIQIEQVTLLLEIYLNQKHLLVLM